MATTESSAPAHPSTEEHDDTIEAHYASLERPHPCIEGVVYVGHLVVAEDGEEVEVVETVPCRRCTGEDVQHGYNRGEDLLRAVASRYGPTPMRVPGCDWLRSGIMVTSSGFLIMPIGRAPRRRLADRTGAMGYPRGTVQPRGRCAGIAHGAY
jgi:hypothetical protein